jgi:diguanylate cyclase (GGDEF)-like protein
MDDPLKAENAALRRRLDDLLAEARRNEEKLRRFDRLERGLIATRSLGEIIRLVLDDYREAFELDGVSLALVDPDYEIARIVAADAHPERMMHGLILLESAAPLERLHRGGGEPLLSRFDAPTHAFLFRGASATAGSVALLPLVSRGQAIGSLNLASWDAERFSPGSGTDFLSRLAGVVAVCVDSAVNHERIRLMGLTDALTGLSNRRYFESRCEEEIVAARRHGQPLACMFLDIDRFKRINDNYGHTAGDEVLRRISQLVRSGLRGSDVLARFGGEEFVALLPQTGLRHATDIAERIRLAVADWPFIVSAGTPLPVTVSIGIAELPAAAAGQGIAALAAELVASADRALYRAKETGRNRVVCDGTARSGGEWLNRWRRVLRALAGGYRSGRPMPARSLLRPQESGVRQR